MGLMTKNIVITGAGRDKVGIVADLSEFLYQRGCNLLDSSMTLLRGEFALILMASLPDSLTADQLRGDLDALQKKLGFDLGMHELTADQLEEKRPEGIPLMISVYGADKIGIVSGVTRMLAELNLNITDLETKHSREGSKELFVMILEVTAPSDSRLEQLETRLAERCRELGVDVNVQELEIVEF